MIFYELMTRSTGSRRPKMAFKSMDDIEAEIDQKRADNVVPAVEKMEPEAVSMSYWTLEQRSLASVAISLKRIADALSCQPVGAANIFDLLQIISNKGAG